MGTDENGAETGIPDFQEQVAKAGEFLNELLSKRANENKDLPTEMEIETIVGHSDTSDGNSGLPPDFSAMLGGLTRDLSRAINANQFGGISALNSGLSGQVNMDQSTFNQIETGHAVSEVTTKDLMDTGSSLAALMAEDFPRDLASIDKPKESDNVSSKQCLGFQCPVCFKTLSSKNNLKKHKLIHEEARYSCEICGKKFTYKWNMESHKIIHSGEKVFKCTQCTSAFFRLADLKKHEKIHTYREKTYFCSYCNTGFFKKSYLKIHEQRHTGEKPFQCQYCPKKFILKTDRNSHERVHTGEKPYECSLCHVRFSSSSNLRRHEKGYCTMNPDKVHPLKGPLKLDPSLALPAPTVVEQSDVGPAISEIDDSVVIDHSITELNEESKTEVKVELQEN